MAFSSSRGNIESFFVPGIRTKTDHGGILSERCAPPVHRTVAKTGLWKYGSQVVITSSEYISKSCSIVPKARHETISDVAGSRSKIFTNIRVPSPPKASPPSLASSESISGQSWSELWLPPHARRALWQGFAQ